MTTIHLMCGFIGFGKTTIAKQIEKEFSLVRLTHDEIMVSRYGIKPVDFDEKYKIVDDFIKNEAKKYIEKGQDVVLDYGFWTHHKREKYYNWAKTLADNVVFHLIDCDVSLAKQRVLRRTKTDSNALFIDENMFDTLYMKYEPWNFTDNYPVVLHNMPSEKYIGQKVFVKIDRPQGSKHPKYGFEYPINYGYVPFTKSGDGEELDAYILCENKPLKEYIGRCVAVIHRLNDDDDKLIIVPDGRELTDEEIEQQTAFQEKWFEHILIRKNSF